MKISAAKIICLIMISLNASFCRGMLTNQFELLEEIRESLIYLDECCKKCNEIMPIYEEFDGERIDLIAIEKAKEINNFMERELFLVELNLEKASKMYEENHKSFLVLEQEFERERLKMDKSVLFGAHNFHCRLGQLDQLCKWQISRYKEIVHIIKLMPKRAEMLNALARVPNNASEPKCGLRKRTNKSEID